jgi:hypothetical protein
LRHQALHRIAGGKVSAFRQLFDVQLDHVFHGDYSNEPENGACKTIARVSRLNEQMVLAPRRKLTITLQGKHKGGGILRGEFEPLPIVQA